MKIDNLTTDEQIMTELGERIARIRLDLNMTQAELAEEAGLGTRTVQRLEHGTVAANMTGFIRVLRALKMADRLDLLVPKPEPSPMALLKMHGKLRQRATGDMKVAEDRKPWTWAE